MRDPAADLARAATAVAAHAKANGEAGEGWLEPVPLFADHVVPLPYPLDVLPPVMRNAVVAYQRFGQQPVAMVASSALASASLASQGLADVDRDGNLAGPSSLAFLIVGESGERKTACDRRMARAIRRWQAEKRSAMLADINATQTRYAAWEARRDGILGCVKRLSGSTEAKGEVKRRTLEADLARLDAERPHPLIEPELFQEDVTPEALAVGLARGWPSSSLWSDEGGLVVGSHAMSEDSALRFVTLINRLWDGGRFSRRRTARDSVTIEGRRLTVSIMMQPIVMARLIAAGDGVTRGTGTLARFLVSWPGTTIGTRAYRTGNTEAAELTCFDDRLSDLLALPLPIIDSPTMALAPQALRLAPAAFNLWRQFHDDVERELSAGGEYADLRDFGAKAAEQAARLACVIHVFEHGPNGAIGFDAMEAGAKLAVWYLHEARRMLGLVGRSSDLADAQALLHWLLEQPCPPTFGDVLRLGPYALRDRRRRDRAFAKLVEHELAREERDGKAARIAVNPALGRTL